MPRSVSARAVSVPSAQTRARPQARASRPKVRTISLGAAMRGPRPPLDEGGGRLRVGAVPEEFADVDAGLADAHKKNDRARSLGERFPVDAGVLLAEPLVTGGEGHR